MGVVYLGQHVWTGRQVAVKVLAPELVEREDLVQRFLREGRAATALRHPNIVDVLDMGVEDENTVYLVMELLEGRSLREELDASGRLSSVDGFRVAHAITAALAHAHSHGVVHRDIKPDNIFLATAHDGSVVPKLLDFGIAKIAPLGSKSFRTDPGQVLGTIHYMSPEQLRDSATVGPASDIWSMGVLLYECFAGRVPFDGKTMMGVVHAICEDTPKRFAGCENSLWELITRCLHKDPRERASAAQLGSEAEFLLVGADSASATSARRRRQRIGLVATAVVLLFGAQAAASYLQRAASVAERAATQEVRPVSSPSAVRGAETHPSAQPLSQQAALGVVTAQLGTEPPAVDVSPAAPAKEVPSALPSNPAGSERPARGIALQPRKSPRARGSRRPKRQRGSAPAPTAATTTIDALGNETEW
jgi:serine/threonine protein kinase